MARELGAEATPLERLKVRLLVQECSLTSITEVPSLKVRGGSGTVPQLRNVARLKKIASNFLRNATRRDL